MHLLPPQTRGTGVFCRESIGEMQILTQPRPASLDGSRMIDFYLFDISDHIHTIGRDIYTLSLFYDNLFKRIAFALQFSQCRILRHVQTRQLIVGAVQRSQCRAATNIQIRQFIGNAVQSSQCLTFVDIQIRQLIFVALQRSQRRTFADIQRLEIISADI